MSDFSFSASWRTSFLPKPRNVSFLGFIVEEGQVSADPEKFRAVKEWPILQNRKELQCFLGFTNFNRCFICDFSHVEADAAFTKLKHQFTTAPVLVHPDPSIRFVVEVDASDTGVGAILSQKQGPENKLHAMRSSHVASPRKIMMLVTESPWQLN